jgi:hypothetical protein
VGFRVFQGALGFSPYRVSSREVRSGVQGFQGALGFSPYRVSSREVSARSNEVGFSAGVGPEPVTDQLMP